MTSLTKPVNPKHNGPHGRHLARCARDLNISLSHLFMCVKGQRVSHSLTARYNAWLAQQNTPPQ